MENASDALHMAAAVLIFVLALSISINAFGQVRQVSQTLVNYNDREYDYTYVEENTDSEGNVLTERIVSLESIIPSIYKAYRENYKVVFRDSDSATDASGLLENGLYRKRNAETGQPEPIYEIDLQNESLGSDTQREQFIMAILYGNSIDNFDTIKDTFQRNSGIYLNNTGIYDIIKDRKLKESVGMYYQEETGMNIDDSSDMETSGSDVPEANLTEKRVITYTVI